MKNKTSLLILNLVFWTAILFSIESKAGAIAVLDVDQIIKESHAMRDIQAKITKKQDEYQKEVSEKQDKLEKEQKKIESKKNILSQEAFEKESENFDKKIDELKTFVDKKQNSLKKASMEAMSKVNDKIKSIIAQIAKEKGYEVIIPSSQTLHYNDELEITDEVLSRLNKSIKKVEVKFE